MDSKTVIAFAPVSAIIPSSVGDRIADRMAKAPSTHVEISPGRITVRSDSIRGTDVGINMLREFLLFGKTMAEFEDRSHHDILMFVYAALALGYQPADIIAYSVEPSRDEMWTRRRGIEYLPHVGRLIPELFNPRYYFLKTQFPFGGVQSAYNNYLLGGKSDVKSLTIGLGWLQKFNLESLFVETNARTIQRLGELRKQRADAFRGVLVELTDEVVSQFKRVRPAVAPEIDATKYPILYDEDSRVPLGETTVCGSTQAARNFTAFTCGVFDQIFAFAPMNNMIVAGNSTRQCIEPRFRPKAASDCDIFIYGDSPEIRKQAVTQLLQAFAETFGSRVYYATVGCVVTVYITGVNRKFQIVCGWFNSAYDVINRFDLSHIQVGAIWTGESATPTFIMTVQCARALTTYTSEVWNTDQLRTERVMKAVYNGFDVESTAHFSTIHIDVKSSLESDKLCGDAIEQFCAYYYPPSGTPTSRGESANIARQIKNDCKGTAVYTNVTELLGTLKLDGEFNSVYGTKAWTEFDVNQVGLVTPKYRGTTVIKTIGNANRFRSGMLSVVSAVVGDENFTIRCQIREDAFTQHLRTLEGSLAGHVKFGARNGRFSRGFLVNNILTLEIPILRINAMKNYGSGIVMDASNQGLDIDDAFRDGDEFYIVYSYGVERTLDANHNQQTFPTLVPFKVVRLRVDKDEDNVDNNADAPTVSSTAAPTAMPATTVTSVAYDDE